MKRINGETQNRRRLWFAVTVVVVAVVWPVVAFAMASQNNNATAGGSHGSPAMPVAPPSTSTATPSATPSPTVTPPTICNEVLESQLEAEDGHVVAPMVVVSDTSALGGYYVHTPLDGLEGGSVRITVTASTEGFYYVQARVWGPTENNNSFRFSVDDSIFFDWLFYKGSTWQWQQVRKYFYPYPEPIFFTVGTHYLQFAFRERDARLDAVRLYRCTTSPPKTFTPTRIPTNTPTVTNTPTATETATATSTATATTSSTATASPTSTPTNTPLPRFFLPVSMPGFVRP